MLSAEKIKKLLEKQDVSDTEIEEIRDGFYNLAEIIFEKWQEETKNNESPTLSQNNN